MLPLLTVHVLFFILSEVSGISRARSGVLIAASCRCRGLRDYAWFPQEKRHDEQAIEKSQER